jgi:hypothetical protein
MSAKRLSGLLMGYNARNDEIRRHADTEGMSTLTINSTAASRANDSPPLATTHLGAAQCGISILMPSGVVRTTTPGSIPRRGC